MPDLTNTSDFLHARSCHPILINNTKQLLLENKFPLLILLAGLIRLVVFPPHRLPALSAGNISYHVSAGGHTSFGGFGLVDIDHRVEEVCFSVLAAEILDVYYIRPVDEMTSICWVAAYPADDVIVVGQMGFALLAAEDLVRVEVYVVGETHRGMESGCLCCCLGGMVVSEGRRSDSTVDIKNRRERRPNVRIDK